ncbi:MAG: radical SAM protein [Deltaproteobacteria bacterium]|nr:radical SAM protein [Deltaproteobacteria bacterium]
MNEDNRKISDYLRMFESCRLCPRECGIDRTENAIMPNAGFCGESGLLRVAYVGVHYGEEPPITGIKGSGTVFFTGCSLKCTFCQNYQISRQGMGNSMDIDELYSRVKKLIIKDQVHNINFVTPDHFFPYTFMLVGRLRDEGYDLPIVYNLSGYQSVRLLKLAGDFADIYLPDYKYSDPLIARELSRCENYPERALEAVTEMVKQKGFLNTAEGISGHATGGVLVRHLILPGMIKNSLNALTTLFLEFGSGLPVSLMSQYFPVVTSDNIHLNRTINKDEFEKVYNHAMELGFRNMFVQFPDQETDITDRNSLPFLPDFRRKDVFSFR